MKDKILMENAYTATYFTYSPGISNYADRITKIIGDHKGYLVEFGPSKRVRLVWPIAILDRLGAELKMYTAKRGKIIYYETFKRQSKVKRRSIHFEIKGEIMFCW